MVRFLNLALNIARQILRFQDLILRLANLTLRFLQLTPRLLHLVDRCADLLLGVSEIMEVAFLLTPPQPVKSDPDQQGDQMNLGPL